MFNPDEVYALQILRQAALLSALEDPTETSRRIARGVAARLGLDLRRDFGVAF